MKLGFKQRLFLYFTLIFSVFTIWIYFFENSLDKQLKIQTLEKNLDVYSEFIYNGWNLGLQSTNELDSLISLFPDALRVTLINKEGAVFYDNSIQRIGRLENHLERAEVLEAQMYGRGTDIRVSTSNQQKYLYYAKNKSGLYLRVALPYTIQTKQLLSPDSGFFYFLIISYFTIILLINWVANRFAGSVKSLRDFALNSNIDEISDYQFQNDELGEIGMQIADSYKQLRESKNQIDNEKEKLLQHIHSSKEGICFFDNHNNVGFYNGLFIQFLHLIVDESEVEPDIVLTDSLFSKVQDFIQSTSNNNFIEYRIQKHGKTFLVRAIQNENQGFELILNDISKEEKTRLLKQEMTGNIAHELRTPVTGIRGYLETILSQNLEEEQQKYFIEKAYQQTKLLSDLIQDVSLISKIEEMGHLFQMEKINLHQLIAQIEDDYTLTLKEHKVQFSFDVPFDSVVTGNQNLLYSIFRNLLENAIRYAGTDIEVKVNRYKMDREFYYFSFYDTGVGIPNEEHLPRLFERFYRISEGRTRATGGTGLGLSIVKNAIAIHGGMISVKNRKEGGLEFLFQVKR